MNFDQISKYLNDDFFVFNKSCKQEDIYQICRKKFALKYLDELELSPNLFTALVHKSFKHEKNVIEKNNEKLEFLGDAVLELIISEFLFQSYPDKSEGDLSKLRSAIVNETTLTEIAKHIDLGRFILLGKGELKEKGYEKESLLSDTFEAILGAIYLDQGLDKTVLLFGKLLQDIKTKTGHDYLSENIILSFDAKSKLQEIVMKKYKTTPRYEAHEIESAQGKVFEVTLIVGEKTFGKTQHASKKKAMQLLAKEVLEKNIL